MIASLRGVLLDRDGETVVVEVAGIGYRVKTTPDTVAALGPTGTEVFVWVHHHIREDHEALYGFADPDDRRSFTALVNARGVGPAMALAILSVHSGQELARIVAEKDDGALCLVSGIGKKTAARLLIELESALDIPAAIATPGGSASEGAAAPGARADVREALLGLGYGADEVARALADLPGDDSGAMLKLALARLAAA